MLQEREGDLKKAGIIRPVVQRLKEFLHETANNGAVDSDYLQLRFNRLGKIEFEIKILLHEGQSDFGDNRSVFKDIVEPASLETGELFLNFPFQQEGKNEGGGYRPKGESIYLYYDLDQFYDWMVNNSLKKFMHPFDPMDIRDASNVDGADLGMRKIILDQIWSDLDRDYRHRLLAQFLMDAWSGWWDNFAHELQHFLDHKKFFDDFTAAMSDYKGSQGSYKDYFNHPAELEAYFRKASEKFFSAVQNKPRVKQTFYDLSNAMSMSPTNPNAKENLRDNIQKATRMLLDVFQDQFNDDFWEYLTPENKKRMKKRMYTVLQQSIENLHDKTNYDEN